LDELDAPPPAPPYDQAALRSLHRAGVVALIGTFVAACGFGLQAFLGGLGTASADVGPDRPPVAALQETPSPAASTYRLPPPADASPGPDQQAAFLATIQSSGTGGWSNRYDLVRFGLQACRLLSTGQPDADVVDALVADGENVRQADAVVRAAPTTLCPPESASLTVG
jgi:hypothetical protein